MKYLTSLFIINLIACTPVPTVVEIAPGDDTARPDFGSDISELPQNCLESSRPTTLEDDTVGFNAAELLATVNSPFSSVTWSVRTADVLSESMALICDRTPLSAAIITREVVGEVQPGECVPGPELRVFTTCTIDIGNGGITGIAETTFQGSNLDTIMVTSLVENVTVATDRLEAAAGGYPVRSLSVIILGEVSHALVEIDIDTVSPMGDPMVAMPWLGEATR